MNRIASVPIARESLPPSGPVSEAALIRQATGIPWFRALLRTVEGRFYQALDLPRPILDLGCGEGHFAAHALETPVEVGLDPAFPALKEAAAYRIYRLRVCASGAAMPFPDAAFATVVSNSVLEHIPPLEDVLWEVARVLRPGGYFVFSVPNERFEQGLSLARLAERLGLRGVARVYRWWFQRISRHVHCDPPDIWVPRLERAGFTVLAWWHYFPMGALCALEWGHYFGVPALLVRMLTGRWLLVPRPWNVRPITRLLRRFLQHPIDPEGAYTFYIARKPE